MQPRPPVFRDPLTEITVLRAIFVAGIAREVGSKATMSLSDAQALAASTPPSVEFLK